MPVNPSVIVDNIAADLTTASGLTPTTIKKYAEPQVINADLLDLPILAVWTEDTDYTPLDTAGAYSRVHHLVAAWYEYDQSINNHGFDDPSVVTDLDAVREQLVARVAAYSQGIPGVTQTGGTKLCATLRTSALTPHDEAAGVALVVVTFDVDDWA